MVLITVRIVAEIVASGDSVSAVARRHGLSPQQLFGWRRELQAPQTALSRAEKLQCVPAVLDASPSSPPIRRQRRMPRHQVEPGAGMIEVEIDGVQDENGKLKKLLADAMLDNAALKDLLSKKW